MASATDSPFTRRWLRSRWAAALLAAQAVLGFGPATCPVEAAQLVGLSLNERTGTTTANSGSLGGTFTLTATRPAWTTNAPGGVGSAIDYGTTVGNFGVDSPGVLAGLGNLPRFTITGWLNCRSTTTGAGGNRVARWYVGGGHGVELVYRNDGSLDLGVNAFSSSVARSTAGRIPTSAGAAPGNWRFFAVTYDSTLAANQVRYYFGTPTNDAVLDVTRTYAAGPVGPNVGVLTVGAVNPPARATSTDRMFRGLMDDVRIFDTVLSPTEILATQGRRSAVSIAAVDPTASEPGVDTGTFRLTRTGNTAAALTVNLAFSGEAANGVDYALLPATAVIPAGATSVDVVVTPLDDTVYDPEPVIATISAGTTYLAGTVATATINLLDNDPPPFFDAQEIFPPVGLTLAVPPVNYTGPVINDTRVFPAGLPVGTIASIVLPAATIVSMTPAGAGFEFVVNNGGEDFTIYTHGGTGMDAGLTVGSVVRVVSTRTVAAGPIVADVIRIRPGPPGGLDISFLYQGVVSYASSIVWTVGGVDFAIIKNGPLPTDIALNGPPVIGSTLITVQYFPNATFPGLGPPPANYLDAAEIFPPVALTLEVPPTLFRNPRTDLTEVPVHILPAGSVCVVVIPGGTITAINTDPVTGGREYAVSTGTETLYVYNHLGTGEDAGLAVGSVVRVVATRSLLPGPVVADVIRARPDPLDGSSFAFFYQGVVTRADANAWTIGGVDFNIVGPSGGLPTSFAVALPPTLGTTVVQVEYVVAPNAVVPPPALVSIAASDAAADEFGPDLGNYVVTRTIPTNLPLVVNYLLSGTASNGVDYAPLSGSVTIPAGSFSVDLALTPVDDLLIEAPETAIVTVQTNAPFYNVGAPASATVTIADDDTPPTVSIAATDAAAAESGPDTGTVTFTRTAPLHRAVTVNYLIGGTAGNGTDYALLGSSVTIPAGSATATVTVTPIDDPTREPSETVTLTLLANLAYSLGTPTNATVTIADDDAPSVVTVAATDAAAAEAGLDPGTLTITRTIPTNAPLTVVYVTSGTATHGVDYTSVTNSIVIPAAAFSADIVVTPIDDLLTEGTETVTVTLQASASYDLGATINAAVSIADDEVPSTVTVAAPDAAAAEALLDPGLFVVTRSLPTNLPLVVNYLITGTAANGTDYASVAASVTIPAASFTAQIQVTPVDDTVVEPAETVVVTLQSSATYVLGATASATVTIADNDTPPFPQPLVQLRLNENTGTTTVNSGTLGGVFTRTAPTPAWTTNRPPTVGGVSAVDFGTTVGNFGVDSPGVLAGLGNLQRFTLTGWLNNRNTSQGSGGNRVIRNYVSGAHGIDLVYRSDGAMDLGVNEFPGSRARSNRDRITTSAGAAVGNWRFFAVTYDGTLTVNNVRFYFGSAAANAALDVTASYPAGPVGPNVGPLTIGHVNVSARAGSLDRMFRGLVDDVRIFGVALTQAEVISVQRGTAALPRLLDGSGSFTGSPIAGLNLSVTDGLARLAWPSELGQSYRIEFLDALGGGEWQVLTPEHPGDGSTVILEDAVKDQPQRFYRVFRLGTP